MEKDERVEPDEPFGQKEAEDVDLLQKSNAVYFLALHHVKSMLHHLVLHLLKL